jgi:predicted RNA-binding protein with PUA-like domain
VKNPVAQRNLREMKKGDRVFFYHTGKEKAIIGTATVLKPRIPIPRTRPAAWSSSSSPPASAEAPGHAAGDQGRQAVRDDAARADCALSVQPVTDEQWDMIEEISKH